MYLSPRQFVCQTLGEDDAVFLAKVRKHADPDDPNDMFVVEVLRLRREMLARRPVAIPDRKVSS